MILMGVNVGGRKMPALKSAPVFLIFLIAFLARVENKSNFDVGSRNIGDEILVRDVLKAPPASWTHSPTIHFNYTISVPISYILIVSEANIPADVYISYANNLVKGTVTAKNMSQSASTSLLREPLLPELLNYQFEVLIRIYGFNGTVFNLNSNYVLKRDQNFIGTLEPQVIDDDDYLGEDDWNELNGSHNGESVDETLATEYDDMNFEIVDDVVELGRRQHDDYEIYETFQTSTTRTDYAAEHSVTFYYVDNNLITCAKFLIYDRYIEKSAVNKSEAIAVGSFYTPTTLKAVITDRKTTSLFVKMTLYGYKPDDLPVDYVPFQSMARHGAIVSTAAPMSSLQQLKALLKAQQRDAMDAPVQTIKIQDSGDNNVKDANDDNNNANGNDSDQQQNLNTSHEIVCRNSAASIATNLFIVVAWWCGGTTSVALSF